jgi:RNA-directed DNA polymerase
MKPNLIRDKIHSKLEDYNKYFYGPQYDVIFRFEQVFFVSQLLSVVKISDLRILLKAQLSKISNLMNKPSYITFSIPKKRGGNRLIQSPDANLMRIQSRLNFYLQNYYHLIRPEGIHGFVINTLIKNTY